MTEALTQAHQDKIDRIRETMETEKLTRHTKSSHMTRAVGKPMTSLSPYLKELNDVLLYDPNAHTVWVEGGMTVEKLTRWALQRNVVPPVVPEFRHITVGGAITGTALESSSFQYGQFNDTCLEVELLFPDGTVRRASSEENRELFHALPGSYGTLGGIAAVKIPLLQARDFVSVECRIVESMTEVLFFFEEQAKTGDTEYVDAVTLSPGKIVVMAGRQVLKKHVSQASQLIRFSYPWSPWWITHLVEQSKKGNRWRCHFPIADYLFRFDRGAFWMGQFITPRTIGQFMMEYGFRTRNITKSLHRAFRKTPPSLEPTTLIRVLAGWKLSSQQMYRVLHSMPEQATRNTFFVHDFYIPWHNVSAFVDYIQREIDIDPLWLCPVKGSTDQFLSPHFCRETRAPMPDFVNVGVYGVPKKRTDEIAQLTREAEAMAKGLGGRKMLYSANEYRKDEFWSIYDRPRYEAIRNQYGCSSYPDLFQKI